MISVLMRRRIDPLRAALVVLLAPSRRRAVFARAVVRWSFAHRNAREDLVKILRHRAAGAYEAAG